LISTRALASPWARLTISKLLFCIKAKAAIPAAFGFCILEQLIDISARFHAGLTAPQSL
jgi:hypothetical protein